MPERVVVWDIDRTIVRSSLERHFLAYLKRRVERYSAARTVRNVLALGIRLPIPAWYQIKLAYLRGFLKTEVDEWFLDCFEREIRPAIYAGASTAIAQLKSEHVRQVLLSGTPRPLAERMGEHFGLVEIIAAEPEYDADRYTGRLLQHHPHGRFKAFYLEAWLNDHGLAWPQVTVLADHHDDRFLMEKAGVAIAVNPSPRLGQIAATQGWAIVRDASEPFSILSVLEPARD